MELREALSQISQIREQIACDREFTGYRPFTTAFSGAVAIGAAAIQLALDPLTAGQYLALWIGAAFVSVSIVASEMIWRARRSDSALQRDTTVAAAEQFIPCLAAGGLLTLALVLFAAQNLWMLPGLWAVLFSMGIYSSRRMLPRGAGLIAAYYLLAGLISLCLASTSHEFCASAMAWEFGVGQFLAAILLFGVERKHGRA